MAGLWRTSEEAELCNQLPGAFLLLLAAVPSFTGWGGFLSLLPLLCALVGLELRPRWETCITCAGAVLMAVYWIAEDVHLASLVTALVMVAAGIRFMLSSGEGMRSTAEAAWVVALIPVLAADDSTLLTMILAALPLAAFTIVTFTAWLPHLRPLYVLP